jgi:photosystem II stability/assembly factor-like uncharacterized protein
MTTAYEAALTAYSRVFLIDGGARPDHAPSYKSCLKAGGPDMSFGTVESIECPDPDNYGKFVTMANLRGAAGRASLDVTGRYARDVASDLLEYARRGCRVDLQIHFGSCADPSSFTTFDKIVVLEDALIENWSTGDMGALSSDENSAIDETATISAADMYEVLPLNLTERAQSVVSLEVLDVVICDSASCGECEDESTGCQYIYAITTTSAGSPGTPPDIVHSMDGGATWYADDIDSLGNEAPTAVACIGDYVLVTSNASASQHYALKSEIDTVGYDEAWTEVATGYVAGGEPNDAWGVSGVVFIVGDTGYVYLCSDATVGVSVLDAGAATSENLYCVHALNDQLAVAGGDAGAIIFTEDQSSWAATTSSPFAAGVRVNAVWILSELVWLVGGSNGELWYTLNQGTTWTLVADFGAAIHDISFSTDSIGYVAYETTTPRGGIRRTYGGGQASTFKILPEGTSTIAANDRINALATCPEDPNFVVGVGLADDGTDGFIVTGND